MHLYTICILRLGKLKVPICLLSYQPIGLIDCFLYCDLTSYG